MSMNVGVVGAVPAYATVDFARVIRPIAEKYAQVVEAEVKRQWPVDSGTSQKGWSAVATVEGTHARILVTNPVSYAKYVTKKGSDAPVAQSLADQVLAKYVPLMNAEIETAVANALAKAVRPAPPRRGRK